MRVEGKAARIYTSYSTGAGSWTGSVVPFLLRNFPLGGREPTVFRGGGG